jgi:hypothetical protein
MALLVVMAYLSSAGEVAQAQGTIIYVDAEATGGQSGSSWADAFDNLH